MSSFSQALRLYVELLSRGVILFTWALPMAFANAAPLYSNL
jgi:hypothetical protein